MIKYSGPGLRLKFPYVALRDPPWQKNIVLYGSPCILKVIIKLTTNTKYYKKMSTSKDIGI